MHSRNTFNDLDDIRYCHNQFIFHNPNIKAGSCKFQARPFIALYVRQSRQLVYNKYTNIKKQTNEKATEAEIGTVKKVG